MVYFNVSLLAAALLFCSRTAVVEAFPGGAGGCDAGNLLADSPAAAPHQNREIVTGALADAGFEVTVDGETLEPGTAQDLVAVLPHRIALKATADKIFRGFLIRAADPADGVDTTEVLSEPLLGSEVQVAQVCTSAGVGGTTHTNNDEKTQVASFLTTEMDLQNPSIPLTLDISMVVQNRDATSEFYYSQYTVNSITPASNNPPCPVCGNDTMTMPDKELMLPAFPPLLPTPTNITCGSLDNFTNMGFVPGALCGNFQALLGPQCGCSGDGPGTPSPTAPVSSQPTPAITPTPSPPPETSAGASLGFFHAAAVILGSVGAMTFM